MIFVQLVDSWLSSSLKHAYILHWNPLTHQAEADQMFALPFGASRSVYSFLRVAHAIWWVGCTALSLMWTVFFDDDYVTLTFEQEVRHTDAAVVALFNLLGWSFDECGEKSTEFAEVFSALGVSFDFSSSRKGLVKVGNATSRVQELTRVISDVLSTKQLSRAMALRLRGRVQFCDSFLFGRAARLCLQAVTAHARAVDDGPVRDVLATSLSRFNAALRAGRPHEVSGKHASPFFMFTDACYEPQQDQWVAGLGGVLFDVRGKCLGFFSIEAPKRVRHFLGESIKKTIIFELEFLAMLLGMVLWKDIIRFSPLVCFLDNNGSRDLAISGRGRSQVAKKLVALLLGLEGAAELKCWYSRVPSPSNIADLPSREKCQYLCVNGSAIPASDASRAMNNCLEVLTAESNENPWFG
ncbi:unnamed protein product [Symbiodinium natans]|uniref:Uncharacterized protein n=1 Tax=Symbiodinium natans TaxID=878477 RepID=A0A812UCM9_9DINO|nr:unnamed protein product [Symbiodinium natans]